MVTLAEYQDSGAVGSAGVLGLAAAWACVNLLAGTIASPPLMVYRTGLDGRRIVATDHPLYRVLHDSPTADQTVVDFWAFLCAFAEERPYGQVCVPSCRYRLSLFYYNFNTYNFLSNLPN